MKNGVFYINGEYVLEQDAKISVQDLGILRGYGVFDYLRTYEGKPFHLQDHLLRLEYSASLLGIRSPLSLIEMTDVVEEVLQRNRYLEAGIKILVTGGLSSDFILPQGKESLFILVSPLKPFPEYFYEQGISLATTRQQRSLSEAKTIYYAPAIIAMQEALKKGASDALFVNREDCLLEATTSNFFVFKDGYLVTPPETEILLGITRDVVLKIAKEHFPILVKPINRSEIEDFEEAFITSSTREIMPVSSIDDIQVPLGAKTALLKDLFDAYTKAGKWPLLNIERHQLAFERNTREIASR